MKTLLSLMSVICATIFMSCTNTANNNLKKLESNTWKLTTLNGETNQAFANDDCFTIHFSPADSTINGVGACNLFFGNFKSLGGNKIDIEMLGATKMACPNDNLEQPFFNMLHESDEFKIKGDNMELMKNGKTCAIFEPFTKTTSNEQ